MPPAPTPPRHLYWIDWMRFLAAAFVLLDHVCYGNWLAPEARAAPQDQFLYHLLFSPIHLGREAVVVFFVLSGALVGGNTLEKIRAGTFDLRAYAADRIARVYVPLVPTLLLCVALLRIFEFPVHPWDFVGCLFGLQDVVTRNPPIDGPLWSLAYEMWFYVLAGCAAVVAGRRRYPRGPWLAALAGVGVSLGVLCWRLEWFYLACWLVGAGGWWLARRVADGARPWLAAAGFCTMLAGVAGFRPDLLAQIPAWANIDEWPWVRPVAHLTLSAGTVLLLVGVCRAAPRTRVGAWVERAGTALAAFSYTLYLTHYPIGIMLISVGGVEPEAFSWHSLGRFGGWIALCLAVALVMYGLFERQTPRVRRWLRAKLAPAAPAANDPLAAHDEHLAPAR